MRSADIPGLPDNDLRQQAMTCTDDGDRARRAGDRAGARAHYERALALERAAALAERTQPWRGILFKSAAWLAMNANLRDEALRLARLGLADADVPEDVRSMLQEVADAATKVLGRRQFAEQIAAFVEAHPGRWRAACLSPTYPCTEPDCGQAGQTAVLYLPGDRRVRLTPSAEGIAVEWRSTGSRWARSPSDDADAPVLARVAWCVAVALHAEGVELDTLQRQGTDHESVPLWLIEAINNPEVNP